MEELNLTGILWATLWKQFGLMFIRGCGEIFGQWVMMLGGLFDEIILFIILGPSAGDTARSLVSSVMYVFVSMLMVSARTDVLRTAATEATRPVPAGQYVRDMAVVLSSYILGPHLLSWHVLLHPELCHCAIATPWFLPSLKRRLRRRLQRMAIWRLAWCWPL